MYLFFYLIASLIFGCIYLFVKPVSRGFYCDDTSIQYPNRPETVPMWLLGVYGGIGPIVIVNIIENNDWFEFMWYSSFVLWKFGLFVHLTVVVDQVKEV